MTARWRRAARITAAVGLVGLGALALLHTRPARASVLAWVAREVRTRAGVGFEARRLDYNLAAGWIRLLDVRLWRVGAPEAQPGPPPFFEADAIEIDLAPSVLAGRVVLDAARLVRPRVTLVRAADGRWNLPQLPPRLGGARDRRIVPVRRIELDAGTLAYRDDGRAIEVEVRELALDLRDVGAGVLEGRAEAGGAASVRVFGRHAVIDRLRARIRFDGRTVACDPLVLEAPGGDVELAGRLDVVGEQPRVEVSGAVRLDARRLAAWWPALGPVSGALAASGRLVGPLAGPVATAHLVGGVAGGQVTAAARIALGERDRPSTVAVDYRGIALEQVFAAARVAPPVRLAARLDGRMSASWDGASLDTLRLAVENRVGSAARPGHLTAAARRRPLDLTGRAFLHLERGRWLLRQRHDLGRALTVSGDIEGRLGREGLHRLPLTGRLAADAPDLARLLVALDAAGLDVSTVRTAGVRGPVRARLAVSGTLVDPRVVGRVESAGFEIATSGPAALEGQFVLDRRSVELRGLALREGANRLESDAVVSFERRTLEGKVAAQIRDPAAWLGAVPESWRPSGTLAVSARLGGRIDRPVVDLTIVGDAVEVAGQSLGHLDAAVRLADGVLEIERLSAEQGPRGHLAIAGRYDFRGGRYAVAARVNDLAFGPFGRRDPEAARVPLVGRATGELEGTGTLASPVARVRLALDSLAWGTLALGHAEVTAVLSGQQARVSARAPELRTDAEISVGLGRPHRFALIGRVADADLARWWPVPGGAEPQFRGRASLGIEAAGSLDDLAAVDAELSIEALEAQVASARVVLARPARLRYAGGQLAVAGLEVGSGATRMSVSGLLAVSGSASRLAVALDGDLRDLEPLLPRALHLKAEGSLHAEIVATGSPERPDVAADLAITAGALGVGGLPAVHDLDLQATLRDGALELRRLAARWQGAGVAATGRLPLSLLDRWLPQAYRRTFPPGDRAARLSARIDSVTTEVLKPWLGGDRAQRVELDAAAELTAEADGLSIERVRGELAFGRLTLSLGKVSLEQQRPTRLTFGAARLAVADWTWSGPAGDLTVTGGVALGVPSQVDAHLRGRVALRALGAFVSGVAAGGLAQVDLRVAGSAAEPQVTGTLEVTDGELRLAAPRLVVTGAKGHVDLAGDRLVVRRVAADLNGGRLELGGELLREGWRVIGGELAARVQEAAFEWPKGLRTEVSAALTLRPSGEAATLAGRITVRRGVYREPLVLTEQALEAWRGAAAPPPAGASWLDRLRLDLVLASDEQILVDNNYGQVAASLDLRVAGTAARLGMSGRITFEEGGRLYVGGHVYRLERGTIDFVDPAGIEPELAFTAATRVAGYDVTLSVSGSPGAVRAELSADPPLAEGDIVALLLTGQPASDLGFAAAPQMRDQVLGYLSGDLLALAGTRVGVDVVRLERGTRDDLFGVDPALVAAEVDPATRLSLTKRVGEQVEVVLSQNLRAMGRLTWIVLYRPGRGVELRGLSRDDASRAVEVSQRLILGGPRAGAGGVGPARAGARPRVAAVRLELPPGVDEGDLRRRLGVQAGDRFEFDRWQQGRERLEALFRARGHAEVRVRSDRTPVEGREPPAVVLTYRVEPGPATEVVMRGHPLSPRLRRAIAARWASGVFDEHVVADVRDLVRETLARDGYLQARVGVGLSANPPVGPPATKTLTVEVEPGPRTGRRLVEFRGNQRISTSRLERHLREHGLDLAPWLAPASVDAALEALYASEGFLLARVETGEPRVDGERSVVRVTIAEGPLFTVADVRFAGARGLRVEALRRVAGVQVGRPYRPGEADEARRAVEGAYRRAGYARAEVRVRREIDRARAAVVLVVDIDEGPRQIVGDVVVMGARGPTAALAARALTVARGAPASLDAWVESRRRLYETGVFRSADIRLEPLEPAEAGADERVRAVVTVEPHAPYRFRYGIRLGDELAAGGERREGTIGVTADLERRHLFGRAVTAGLTGRYERDRAFARLFARLPRLGPWPVSTGAYVTRSHERVAPAGDLTFVTDRTTVTAQQEARLPRAMRFTYGYTFERNHVFDPHADPHDPFALDYTVDVGRLNAAWASDTRDDPFDPARGWFAAVSLDYASAALGSDLRFVRLLVQGAAFQRAGPAVLAGRLRLGAARGIGQEVVPSERFFAGGATSVRGYAENALGPVDLFGEPAGGNALLVLNGEIRFPVFGGVRGVGFVDAGNVFARLSDLAVGQLEVGVGAGVRVDTPFAMLRLDFGMPVPRRPGGPFGRWYFSLGHAF